MFKVTRRLSLLLVTTLLLAAPACATGAGYPQRYPTVDRDDRKYHDQGFREGRESGRDDAQRGRSYDLRRHSEYRDNRRGDDPGDLRAFRQGFESGYDEGYRCVRARRLRRSPTALSAGIDVSDVSRVFARPGAVWRSRPVLQRRRWTLRLSRC